MGLEISLLTFWLIVRIFIQNDVLKACPVAMIDDIFRVILDEKLLYLADILQMRSVKLYLLLVIKRALAAGTELVVAGVVVETILIVRLRGESVLVCMIFLAGTRVLICLLQEIYIERCVFLFDGFMTICSSAVCDALFLFFQHISLLLLCLFRRFAVAVELYGAETSVHEKLSIVHAELKVDVVPVLDEMSAEILNGASH